MYLDANERPAWKYVDSMLRITKETIAGGLRDAIRLNSLILRHLPPLQIECTSEEPDDVPELLHAVHPLRDIEEITFLWESTEVMASSSSVRAEHWRDAFASLPSATVGELSFRSEASCPSTLFESISSWLPAMTSLQRLHLGFGWPSRSKSLALPSSVSCRTSHISSSMTTSIMTLRMEKLLS
jgi:hypothetical protein